MNYKSGRTQKSGLIRISPFTKKMMEECEMTNLGLMIYFISMQVKQNEGKKDIYQSRKIFWRSSREMSHENKPTANLTYQCI